LWTKLSVSCSRGFKSLRCKGMSVKDPKLLIRSGSLNSATSFLLLGKICCFIWVWNLVCHTEGGTKTEGVRE
jgi:hypothetical protein